MLLQQMNRDRSLKGDVLHESTSNRKKSRESSQIDQSEFTLAALLATGKLPNKLVIANEFEDEQLRNIVISLLNGKSPVNIMEEAQDEQTRQMAGELFNRLPELDKADTLTAAEDCLRKIRSARLNARIKQLSDEIKSQEFEQKALTLELIKELKSELNRQTNHLAQ